MALIQVQKMKVVILGFAIVALLAPSLGEARQKRALTSSKNLQAPSTAVPGSSAPGSAVNPGQLPGGFDFSQPMGQLPQLDPSQLPKFDPSQMPALPQLPDGSKLPTADDLKNIQASLKVCQDKAEAVQTQAQALIDQCQQSFTALDPSKVTADQANMLVSQCTTALTQLQDKFGKDLQSCLQDAFAAKK
jgi:hypothetical protein